MIKNFPIYYQLDRMDCGPTCLRMISKYYGRSFTAQSLREKSGVHKEGVSLLGIAEAAETIGFHTIGVKIPFDKLASEVNFPCIVHWQQHHFVVVYGIQKDRNWMAKIFGGIKSNSFDKDTLNLREYSRFKDESIDSKIHKKVLVADPVGGLISYSVNEFKKNWIADNTKESGEGIVLLIEPTPYFYEQEDEKENSFGLKKLFEYLVQYKKLFLQIFIGLIVGSILQLIFPFLTQSVVDTGVATQNISFIYIILSAQIVLLISRMSVDFIRSWILLYISSRVNVNILSDFFIKLMRLPLAFFDTKHLGDLLQRISDHHKIEAFLTSQTLNIAFSIFNLLIFGLVLFLYNNTIFLVFFVSSLLYIAWVFLFNKYRRTLNYRHFNLSAKNQNSLFQLILGMQEIKLAGAERPMRWEWERLQIKLFKVQLKTLRINQYQQAGAFTINETKNILITFLAAESVINGSLTIGSMLAIQYIIGQLNSPIEQLINFVQEFQDAKISLERLNEIHAISDEEPFNHQKLKKLPNFESISLKNVTFKYPGTGLEPILKNLNLTIPIGQTTAIVGMSGSGKTTILKMLLGFYEPVEGGIYLGETNFQNLSQSFWREQCGVVMQEGFIFSDSIARNIAVGAEWIDTTRLDHAVKVANLQEFIDSLPLGYHTKIGAEGNGISQGQRQRILIARAVYKNPQFILFDEATNSLDANNETIIMENLSDFLINKTVVVVAHRLSTIQRADQIVVLDNGNIVEIGKHNDLMLKRGFYWKLIKNQVGNNFQF